MMVLAAVLLLVPFVRTVRNRGRVQPASNGARIN
jgi:hypothetical protein